MGGAELQEAMAEVFCAEVEMHMMNLSDVNSGTKCRITWLTGQCGDALRRTFDMKEDDPMRVLRNYGSGGVVVKSGGCTLAMSSDAAFYVKVEMVS